MKKVLLTAMMLGGGAAFAGDLYDNMASTPQKLQEWSSYQSVQLLPNGGKEGKYAIEFNCPQTTSKMLVFNVPVDKVKGKKVEFSADVKGENIVTAKAYTGTKLMVYVKDADGKESYREGRSVQSARKGTFDWRNLETEVVIPENAVSVQLFVGIQEASGKVLFSDIDFDIDND